MRMSGTIDRTQASGAAVLAAVVVGLIVGGCSTSRATRDEDRAAKPTVVVQDVNEFIYLAKIKREKEREDDKRVDLKSLRARRGSRDEIPAGINRDQFLLEVVRYLGVRYDYGGSSADGMDCSGFTCQVFKNGAQREIPRSTIEQYRTGRRVSKEDLRFGDLVFFNTTGESPSHVGIYLEDDVFAHASVVEGVTLSSLESTYYKRRFVGARRVLD